MEKIINLYKEISNEILEILKYDKLESNELEICFEKRENIIKELEENKKINDFKEIYKEELYKVDKEIKLKIKEKMMSTKKEIAEYKRNQNGNFAYVNMNKNNFNIFSTKV